MPRTFHPGDTVEIKVGAQAGMTGRVVRPSRVTGMYDVKVEGWSLTSYAWYELNQSQEKLDLGPSQ